MLKNDPNPHSVRRCVAEAPGGGYCNKPFGHIGQHSTFKNDPNHVHSMEEPMTENHENVTNLTDDQLDEIEIMERGLHKGMIDPDDIEIVWDGDPMDLSEEAEKKLSKDIADLDAAAAEELSPGLRREMLMNAADLVDGDRNAQYGDPKQDFRRTVAYWNIHINGVIDRKLAENDGKMNTDNLLGMEDVAIMMSLLKVSRLSWQPQKEDTWTDLAGYAACGWDCAQSE